MKATVAIFGILYNTATKWPPDYGIPNTYLASAKHFHQITTANLAQGFVQPLVRGIASKAPTPGHQCLECLVNWFHIVLIMSNVVSGICIQAKLYWQLIPNPRNPYRQLKQFVFRRRACEGNWNCTMSSYQSTFWNKKIRGSLHHESKPHFDGPWLVGSRFPLGIY